MRYQIGGYGVEIRNFKGKVLDADREEVNEKEWCVTCLDCKKPIEIEKVQIDD